MEIELKPCPFCGGIAILIEEFRYQNVKSNKGGSKQVPKAYYEVKCGDFDCKYEPGGRQHHDEASAIKAWNERKP